MGTFGDDTLVVNGDKVGIKKNNPTTELDVNGTGTFTSIVETSTRALKEKIINLGSQENIIAKLEPVSYIWKDSKELDIGLIAEDVNEIAPLLVYRNSEGIPTGIKYSKLGVILLNSVKDNTLRIKLLEDKVRNLQHNN